MLEGFVPLPGPGWRGPADEPDAQHRRTEGKVPLPAAQRARGRRPCRTRSLSASHLTAFDGDLANEMLRSVGAVGCLVAVSFTGGAPSTLKEEGSGG